MTLTLLSDVANHLWQSLRLPWASRPGVAAAVNQAFVMPLAMRATSRRRVHL